MVMIFALAALLILPYFNKERDLQSAYRVLCFIDAEIKITTLRTAIRLKWAHTQRHHFERPATLRVTLIGDVESIVCSQVQIIQIKNKWLHIDNIKVEIKNIDKIKILNHG